MFPLAMAKTGDLVMVAKIGGPVEVRKHLEDLGFVPKTRWNHPLPLLCSNVVPGKLRLRRRRIRSG